MNLKLMQIECEKFENGFSFLLKVFFFKKIKTNVKKTLR